VPRQARSSGEGAGRRFKRRRKRRGKRGVVSEKRGLDKTVEGKERTKRDRTERPGDRREKFQRSRKRRPKRRQKRQGGDRKDFGRDRPQTGRPLDREQGGRQFSDMKARIDEIRSRRESFAADRPEQVAERRGVDTSRFRQLPGGPQPDPQGRPTNLDQVNAYDAVPEYNQPQPAPAPGPQLGSSPGGPMPVQIGPDGRVVQPQPGVVEEFTPIDHPGPTAPPGVATDAYGKPVPSPSGPYNPAPPQPGPGVGDQRAGYMWSGREQQVNPRAAGMDRFAQPPQQPPIRQEPDRPY